MRPYAATGVIFAAVGLLAAGNVVALPSFRPAPPTDAGTPPASPALALIDSQCSACHETTLIFNQHKTPDDWAATVHLMMDRGADLKPEQSALVIDYLSKNFPDNKPGPTSAP